MLNIRLERKTETL